MELWSYTRWQVSGTLILYMVTGQWSSDLIHGDRSVELWSYTRWQVSRALILYKVTGQWSYDLIHSDRSVELSSYAWWQVSGALILYIVTGQWSSDLIQGDGSVELWFWLLRCWSQSRLRSHKTCKANCQYKFNIKYLSYKIYSIFFSYKTKFKWTNSFM